VVPAEAVLSARSVRRGVEIDDGARIRANTLTASPPAVNVVERATLLTSVFSA
jgi:hypothetical protein